LVNFCSEGLRGLKKRQGKLGPWTTKIAIQKYCVVKKVLLVAGAGFAQGTAISIFDMKW